MVGDSVAGVAVRSVSSTSLLVSKTTDGKGVVVVVVGLVLGEALPEGTSLGNWLRPEGAGLVVVRTTGEGVTLFSA